MKRRNAPDDDWTPTIIDRIAGAVLAFRTDIPDWYPAHACVFCESTMFARPIDDDRYETRCFHCGATGTGGRVKPVVDPKEALPDR